MKVLVLILILVIPKITYTQVNDFKDNEMTGSAKIFFIDGDIYEGDVLNATQHGVGTHIYKSGQIFQGEYLNGKRNGMGKITWTNGDTSYGSFKDGDRHGSHDYTFADGTKQKVLYDKGKKVD